MNSSCKTSLIEGVGNEIFRLPRFSSSIRRNSKDLTNYSRVFIESRIRGLFIAIRNDFRNEFEVFSFSC